MTIGVHVYFQIMVVSEYTPRSGIAGWYVRSTLGFSKGTCILFSLVANLPFYQQCKRVPFSSHPPQDLLFADFSILTGGR